MMFAQAATEAAVPPAVLKLFGISNEAVVVSVGLTVLAAVVAWWKGKAAPAKEPAEPVAPPRPAPCLPAVAALAEVSPRVRYTLDTPTRDISRDVAEARAIMLAKIARDREDADIQARLVAASAPEAPAGVEAAPKPARGRKAT